MKVGFFSRRLVSYFCIPAGHGFVCALLLHRAGVAIVTLDPNKGVVEHMAVTSGRSEKGFLE